jgi:hypothetical protein
VSDTAESRRQSALGYRLTLGAVILLGVLILIGIGVLIFGLTTERGHVVAAPPHKTVTMTLAPGYTILSADSQPGRLVLHIRSATRDEIDIIDLNDGRIVSRIHSQPPK